MYLVADTINGIMAFEEISFKDSSKAMCIEDFIEALTTLSFDDGEIITYLDMDNDNHRDVLENLENTYGVS